VVDEEELKRMMQAGLDALYARQAPVEAIAVFERVLAKSPTHYGASYQLATALERAGRAGEARAQWARVLTMAEGYSDGAVMAEARARLGGR
jgi:cytochrome c-type biogenesis protein CcmH/NrfG